MPTNRNPNISDNELILYFYRDGLSPRRIDEIDDALFASPPLRLRYTELQRMLHEIDAGPAPEPDAEFTQRMWRNLAAQIERAPLQRSARRRGWFGTGFAPRFALAATALIAIAVGVGYYAGRITAPQPDEIAQARANARAAHVLDAYVAEHLRTTEGLLLTAANSDNAELLAGNRALAQSLVDSNRLYALAAARSGNARLADFLRQLEPVLLELANQPADASIQSFDGLRDYLRKTDLLFQVRATQARLDPADKHRI